MNIERIPTSTMLTTFLSFLILVLVGHIRDCFGKVFYPRYYTHLKRRNNTAPLYTAFESFFTRRLYSRIRDCWNRPVTGVPARTVSICERISTDYNETFTFTGRSFKCLNFSSYNYLGLNSYGPLLEEVVNVAKEYPINYPGATRDIGSNPITLQLEKEMASFLGKEACLVFAMGFGTNSCNIPIIMGKGCLVLSDEFNHTSIIYGTRMSESLVVPFAHNNVRDLETKLRYYISQGQPITHRAWKKIFVIVEGLYSMEGTVLRLKEMVSLKKKYKFYLFIDEAHSIGALGETGRGVCEYTGVDTKDVDILMGTFTKSFGGSGGYIASTKELIDHLRFYSDFALFGEQLAPAVSRQILGSLNIIKERGSELTFKLLQNTVYFRTRLREMGFVVFGDRGSPIVPLMIFNPGKIAVFSRMCLERRLAVVVVGYPATPVISSRVRLCVSAAHTKHDIDAALRVIEYVGKYLCMDIKTCNP